MPIYKLSPIELHTGYKPKPEWKNVETMEPPPPPTWVPGTPRTAPPNWNPNEPMHTMPDWEIAPEPDWYPDYNQPGWDEDRDFYNGDGWVNTQNGGWYYMGPPSASSNGWQWNFDTRIWEYNGPLRDRDNTGWVYNWETNEWEYHGNMIYPYQYNGWVWNPNSNPPAWEYRYPSQQATANLESVFIPDQLIIYISVYSKPDYDSSFDGWDPRINVYEIENDIVEIGTLRMGFDEEEYSFAFEDITFKVQNDTGVWGDKIDPVTGWGGILDPDMVSEIRIIHTHITKDENGELHYSEPKGVFYGVIDKNISHTDSVGFDDENYSKYREYEFTALNYFSNLKEHSIKELKEKIKAVGSDYQRVWTSGRDWFGTGQPAEWGWTDDIVQGFRKTIQNIDSTRATVHYIKVVKLFENIFRLIFPNLNSFVIKSDTRFKNTGYSSKEWFLDSNIDDNDICIYFYTHTRVTATLGTKIFEKDIYTKSFFDDDYTKTKTAYSFFKHENCLSLLKELLIDFGLVWRAKYEIIDEVRLYRWNINFELLTRFEGEPKNIDNDEVHNDIEGNMQAKKFNDVQVSITGYEDVTNYKVPPEPDNTGLNPVANLWNKYALQTSKIKKITTPFISWIHNMKSLLEPHATLRIQQCLFGYWQEETKMIPINQYIACYGTNEKVEEVYPNPNYFIAPVPNEDKVDIESFVNLSVDHNYYRQFFAEMVANYYAGQYGIYTNFARKTLSFTIDGIDVEPLDTTIIQGKQYIITEVEKNFMEGTSKLTLKEYKNAEHI